nr:MAG TPA: hypothetical protein [Caudoviricetes sp.]
MHLLLALHYWDSVLIFHCDLSCGLRVWGNSQTLFVIYFTLDMQIKRVKE